MHTLSRLFCIFLLMFLFFGCIQLPGNNGGSPITPPGNNPPNPTVHELTLEELNHNLQQYENEKVKLTGYFGHKSEHGRTGMSYLVKDKMQLYSDEPMPEFSYVRLDTDIPSSVEPKNIVVQGTVEIGTIDYPLDIQDEVAVIIVEDYSVIG